MKKKVSFLLLLQLFSYGFCFAETEGEKLFRTNKPNEASVQLEKEILEGSASSDA